MKATRKSAIIEATVLFTVPKNSLMRMVMISDSIDSMILDLQEIYPDGKITRDSILNWKFMTVGDVQKDKNLIKELSESGVKLYGGRSRIKLPNDERSVATDDDSSTEAGTTRKPNQINKTIKNEQ